MLLCLYCQDRYGSLDQSFPQPLPSQRTHRARVQDAIAAGPEIDGMIPLQVPRYSIRGLLLAVGCLNKEM